MAVSPTVSGETGQLFILKKKIEERISVKKRLMRTPLPPLPLQTTAPRNFILWLKRFWNNRMMTGPGEKTCHQQK